MSPAARDWDAASYDRVSTPQVEWALGVLDRLPLNGDETVLDAGCGSGRVTRLLLERLPDGRVIGVDSSPSMIEKAREALGPDVELHVMELTELELDHQVDAVFSNAVFHWIQDHDALFRRLYGVMRPGGRLVAQCGGAGNVERFLEVLHAVAGEPPFEEYVGGRHAPWNFTSPAETAARLDAAGFVEADCWLERKTVTPDEPAEFMRTVCLGEHLELLPEDLRPLLVERMAERAGSPLTLEYVRLNIDARRPD